MSEEDPRVDPETAPVINYENNQPYGKRSINAVFGFVIAVFLIGGFTAWFFFTPDEDTQSKMPYYAEGTQKPGNEYEAGSGRSAVYNFFYNVFGGIDDGLEDNPHNLENVERIDQFDIDVDMMDDEEAVIAVEEYAERRAALLASIQEDDFRHSFLDVEGSDVIGRKGDRVGKIHDVVVHRETGMAKAIVVDEDGSRYERDLAAVRFKRITRQSPDGDVRLTIAEERVEAKPEFYYQDMNEDDYVSLRHLRHGQILDYRGEVAGQVEAVIYENAEAQNIYFALKPRLVPAGKPRVYGLPFEEVNIVENPDGFDIQLTREQTESLAETLYEQPPVRMEN